MKTNKGYFASKGQSMKNLFYDMLGWAVIAGMMYLLVDVFCQAIMK